VNAVAIDRDNLAWIGTDNGLASCDKTAGVINPPPGLSSRSLSAYNYPNPFTRSTTIKYSVPEDAHTLVRIFTIDGKTVATLVNERKRAGSYFAHWNVSTASGSALHDGIYLCTFICGKNRTVWKINLLR
jgi:hypothetical protein